jgi:hypothetical protein
MLPRRHVRRLRHAVIHHFASRRFDIVVHATVNMALTRFTVLLHLPKTDGWGVEPTTKNGQLWAAMAPKP